MRLILPAVLALALFATASAAQSSRYFTIEVVDDKTGRGVPLVELRTTHAVRYYTDSAGVAAIDEPSLAGQKVFFFVESHGYEMAADGFGNLGTVLELKPGGKATVNNRRQKIAERLYRLTGEGAYRDSILVGRKSPVKEPLLNAQVLGQDSVQNVVYQGKLFWMWGDTSRPSYPLGNFNMTGATSRLPGKGGLDPARGVDLEYFKSDTGFTREMAPVPGPGPTWLGGLVVLPEAGKDRLYATYVKIKNQLETYERGLVRYNDEKGQFEPAARFPLDMPVFPTGHTAIRKDGGVDYVYFGDPFPLVRIRAEAAALRDAARYEAYTCLREGSRVDAGQVDRDAAGVVRYAWRLRTPPVDPEAQEVLIRKGVLKREEALFRFRDPDGGKPVVIHRGTVTWNAYRKRWIMIATEIGGTSHLGEVWYSEAENPLGPWEFARKIATHRRYSFYNPAQHPEFDQEGGRLIYFEGTYTNSFSGNPDQTPRYDYNQVMYRLDLSDPRLAPTAARASRPERVKTAGYEGFVRTPSGRPFRPWGVNYGNSGRLIEDYWERDWSTVEADFAEMRDLGYNTVRVHLQLGRFMESPTRANEKSLERLDALLRLAERTGLYLDLTGLGCYRPSDVPAWYDALSEAERWSVQERFWTAIARRGASSTAVFCYDLMNEPLVPGGARKPGEWYSGKLLGGLDFLQWITLDQGGRERTEIARQWIARLKKAIRAEDPHALITVGLLPSIPKWGYFSGFDPKVIAPELDFVSVHIYPEQGKVDEAVETLRGFRTAKPLVIEETFPLSCSAEELEQFLLKSRPVASGWVGHYDGSTPADYGQRKAAGTLTAPETVWLSWLDLSQRLKPAMGIE
ncbi:MAG: hypothetical protein K0Q72_2121 [Armatimonadetes bacterium]|nr:hypothetical protein [Armatimonadota bacterium]